MHNISDQEPGPGTPRDQFPVFIPDSVTKAPFLLMTICIAMKFIPISFY